MFSSILKEIFRVIFCGFCMKIFVFRYVANVIVGILDSTSHSKPYLLAVEVLENANSSSIAKVFNDPMSILWPDGIQYNKVLLFVTDAAPYMVKAATGLQILYEKMIHLTCLAHGLHRVAEKVREMFGSVNNLIASTKKVFCKAPHRVQIFKDTTQIPLPPEPILTRWGTWIHAAEYYAQNFETIKTVLNKFDKNDAICIENAQKSIAGKGIREDLLFILCNFVCLAKAITKLETQGSSIQDCLELINETEILINKVRGPKALSIKQKLENVLEKNAGFHLIKEINDVLLGQGEIGNELKHYTLTELNNFKYAPVTSCDVERSFSKYKNIFTDKRHKFTFENLKMYVIVNVNCSS